MKILLEQWICNDCEKEFFTGNDDSNPLQCPHCGGLDFDTGATMIAQRWRGEGLEEQA